MRTTNRGRRIQCSLRTSVFAWGAIATATAALAQAPYTTWSDYKGSPDSSNYSALKQIDHSNVNRLEVAWTFQTNDKIEYPFAPVVIGRTMFAVARNGSLVAVDATSGKELWVQDFGGTPVAAGARGGRGNSGINGYRGLNYWESKDRSGGRILVRAGGYLQAVDAATGKLVQSFGDNGRVDLGTGIDRNDGPVTSRSPGRVFENLIILGSATGTGYGRPPGDIRAFDTVTGKLVWVFHTVPRPGEFGYETNPPDAWKYMGGANNWGDMSLDVKRGIVFIPTGSPTYDFYGGDRKGDNLFGDCLLALDARTGKRLWHFQDVHHDLWDYDLTSAPQLVTVQHDGRTVDAVAQAGKTGFLYVFERATGKPLWPIEERPVPKSDVPGEFASPTQPFPTKPPPFAVQKFTVDDISPYMMSPEYRAKLKEFMLKSRNDGMFTPPTADRFLVQMPGHSGGAGVFSSSSDPQRGIVFIQSFNEPAFLKLETSEAEAATNAWYGPYFPPAGANGFESVAMAADDVPWGLPRSMGGVSLGVSGRGAGRGGASASSGRTIYEQQCLGCHGASLDGGNGQAPPLVGVLARLGRDGVLGVVREGRGSMPPFGTLAAGSLDALLAYLSDPALAAAGARGGRGQAVDPDSAGAPARHYFTAYGWAPGAIKPPWATITAYDLNTGTIKWQVPYGEALGVPPAGNNFGVLRIHGVKANLAVTAGRLMFAATVEHKIRAYDSETGKVLWTAPIPGGAEGSPAVYEIDGRQYVVVGCRGSYTAFALPKTGSK